MPRLTRTPIRPALRNLAASLTVAVIASTLLTSAPASANAGVPVDFQGGYGTYAYAWEFGAPTPATRVIGIGASTRMLDIALPFRSFNTLTCTLRDAAGVVRSRADFPWTEGFVSARLPVPAGFVVAGSKAIVTVECRDRTVDWIRARYSMLEQAGAPATLTLTDDPSKLTMYATRLAYIPEWASTGPHNASGAGQTIMTGDTVRLIGDIGAFRPDDRTPSLTATLTSGAVVLAGQNVWASDDGSMMGFTVPPGLTSGRVDIAMKSVSTTAGTLDHEKVSTVTTWYDYAYFDPQPVAQKLTATPRPGITGPARVGATLTVLPGIWAPAPVALTYQWLQSGSAIAGATGSTYVVRSADAGKAITVAVTGSKVSYTTVTKTSYTKTIAIV